jgi:hypothetical protein
VPCTWSSTGLGDWLTHFQVLFPPEHPDRLPRGPVHRGPGAGGGGAKALLGSCSSANISWVPEDAAKCGLLASRCSLHY